ncbi:MAG: hypothetical protein FWG66_10680 [Spirochaetes bacterium]|nr:hypothetical protein [Spirochaetota bacterium]
MNFFSFFWVPLFYLLWRLIYRKDYSGGVSAFFFGIVTALLQFLFGSIVTPGGFGFSRWLYGFVEIVSLPVLLPMLVCGGFVLLGALPKSADFADFALLWIMPVAVFRALSWGELRDPILLALVPVLWTALAVGIHFFISLIIARPKWYVIIPCLLGILFLPLAAPAVYWAFFSHQSVLGFAIFAAVIIPLLFSVIAGLLRFKGRQEAA